MRTRPLHKPTLLGAARIRALQNDAVDRTTDKMMGRLVGLRRSHPLHRNETSRVFFLIGSGRSGTTLVRRILMSSPVVHIPPELQALPDVIGWYRRYAHMNWDDLATACLAKLHFHPEFYEMGLQLGPLRHRLRALPPSERSLNRILSGVHREHARHAGRERADVYGDKTPRTTLYLNRVDAVFPDAKFVHVVRDGMDAVCSFVENEIYGPDAAAQQWLQRTRCARRFAARHPERCRTVRYEDLVAEPQRIADELATFLGLPEGSLDVDAVDHVGSMEDVLRTAHHTRVSQAITPERVGRWERVLTARDAERVARVIDAERRRWGYLNLASSPE